MGGACLMPDSTTWGKCLLCGKPQRDAARYDLGGGQLRGLDPRCAGRAGLVP